MLLFLALAAVIVLLVVAIVPTKDGSPKPLERFVQAEVTPLKAFSLRQMTLEEESAVVAEAYLDLEQERFRKETVAKAAAMFGSKPTKA